MVGICVSFGLGLSTSKTQRVSSGVTQRAWTLMKVSAELPSTGVPLSEVDKAFGDVFNARLEYEYRTSAMVLKTSPKMYA